MNFEAAFSSRNQREKWHLNTHDEAAKKRWLYEAAKTRRSHLHGYEICEQPLLSFAQGVLRESVSCQSGWSQTEWPGNLMCLSNFTAADKQTHLNLPKRNRQSLFGDNYLIVLSILCLWSSNPHKWNIWIPLHRLCQLVAHSHPFGILGRAVKRLVYHSHCKESRSSIFGKNFGRQFEPHGSSTVHLRIQKRPFRPLDITTTLDQNPRTSYQAIGPDFRWRFLCMALSLLCSWSKQEDFNWGSLKSSRFLKNESSPIFLHFGAGWKRPNKFPHDCASQIVCFPSLFVFVISDFMQMCKNVRDSFRSTPSKEGCRLCRFRDLIFRSLPVQCTGLGNTGTWLDVFWRKQVLQETFSGTA